MYFISDGKFGVKFQMGSLISDRIYIYKHSLNILAADSATCYYNNLFMDNINQTLSHMGRKLFAISLFFVDRGFSFDDYNHFNLKKLTNC